MRGHGIGQETVARECQEKNLVSGQSRAFQSGADLPRLYQSMLGAALYGSSFVLPLYLSQVQGYNAEQIGEVLAWTGIPQLVMRSTGPRQS